MIYILFAIYVLLSSMGLVLFKLGTASSGFSILGINVTFKMLIGIFCYGFSFILWLYIVSKMNLTVAMPLSVALVNTMVIIESCLLLKEKLSLLQVIGIVAIIFGVVIITTGNSR